MSALDMIVSLVFGYLCGTIPFGLILTKSAGLGDIRSIGSGNIGATNVLRTGNKKLAALTLLGDMLKGTAAVLLAAALLGGREAGLVAGLGAPFISASSPKATPRVAFITEPFPMIVISATPASRM
jgi:glycerol-3-phosphate acyltransferase PlsY